MELMPVFFSAQMAVQKAIAFSAKQALSIELDSSAVVVAVPRDAAAQSVDLCSPACFELAKKAGKNPKEIGELLAPLVCKELEKEELLAPSCSVANGYLNFNFSSKFFSQASAQAAQSSEFGASELGAGKKVVMDFSSPNVGKPLHIGHIRSTILGDSIRNLFAFCGYKVTAINYFQDAGAQVAKLILGVRLFGVEKISDEKDLLDYYVRITEKIEESPELKAQVEDIVLKMEEGDEGVARELERVRAISVPPVEKSYELLGVKFDETCFDIPLVVDSKKIVAEAVQKGVAFKDKTGEIVADLEKYKLPNMIILRSNGTTLYASRDLAFADYRFKKYGFDHNVYITASEQNLNFKQVFKMLELLGRPYVSKCEHIGFGLIFLESGEKMSSRKGNVILLEDVMQAAIAKAREEIKRKAEYSEIEVEEIAREVGVGAVKFAVLRVTSEKNINFSPQRAVSFEGDSGAYVQYTYVRAQNILRKAQEAGVVPAEPAGSEMANDVKLAGTGEYNSSERELVKSIAAFPSVVEGACKGRAPQQVCDYLLKLSAAFSSFYAASPVLNAESDAEKQKRLVIVAAAKNVIGNGLSLLGIKLPKKM